MMSTRTECMKFGDCVHFLNFKKRSLNSKNRVVGTFFSLVQRSLDLSIFFRWTQVVFKVTVILLKAPVRLELGN